MTIRNASQSTLTPLGLSLRSQNPLGSQVFTSDTGRLRRLFVAAAISLVAFSGMGWAGEYRWIKYPKPDIYPSPEIAKLCQGFEKNVNSLGPLKDPLLCERPFNPNFKDFSKPQWTTLDPRQHIALIKKMDNVVTYSGYKAPPFDERAWRERLDKRLPRIGLALTKVDLNGDEYPEVLIRFNRREPCDFVSAKHLGLTAASIVYFVTDEKFSEVMQLGPWAWGAELFVHQGTAYFSQVHYKTPPDEYLMLVHHPLAYHGDPTNLCQLRFMPDKCPAGTRPRFAYATSCKLKYREDAVTKKGK
ncbi:MAG: hypothetical protein ACREVD_09435 [Burkholderiales bacterium]